MRGVRGAFVRSYGAHYAANCSWDNGAMIRPLALAIAWRYLRAPTRNRFVSFIGLASVIGMALGVAALIVVISVMDGFAGELRDRLLRFDAQVSVVAQNGLDDWRGVAEELAALPGVRRVGPVVELEALLMSRRRYAGVRLLGIAADPGMQAAPYGQSVIDGSFAGLHDESGGLAVGRYLANTLGVRVGDTVRILIPRPNGATPALQDLPVSAVFVAGNAAPDSSLALAGLGAVSELAGLEGRISALQVSGDDPYGAPGVVEAWAENAGVVRDNGLTTRSWMQQHETLFRTVQLERLAMGALLFTIIAVAAFNIVATLVMSVNERRSEIAILATLGARTRTIMAVFSLQGLLAGLAGVGLGGALGVWLTLNVDAAMRFLENLFGFDFLPAESFYLTGVPAELTLAVVVAVTGLALLLSVLASWYPSRHAARVDPASILRYE